MTKLEKRDIYGSFSLGESEFALSVKSIQEVVNEPDHYKPVPLAPDYLLGLFNLRGMIIPVIDLGKILEIPRNSEVKSRKVAIIECNDACVGILFDRTSEVFDGNRLESNIYSDKGTESIKEQVIKGFFKINEGKRIVQIIDPYSLLKIDDIPLSDESVAERFKREKKGKKNQCISFNVGPCLCAIDISAIQEIVMVEKIDTSVLASDICLGSVWVRENTIPVINFEKILGHDGVNTSEANGQKNKRLILMKIENDLFGLLVTSVESIISYFEEDIISFPVLNEDKKDMFKGCIPCQNNEETILLNHTKIFTHEEINRITKGHRNLYGTGDNDKDSNPHMVQEKNTYITFSIDNDYAIDISQVKEVIDYPDEILSPPGLSHFMKGVFNLRGDFVTIIDLRAMYNMADEKAFEQSKLLIFAQGSDLYALIVDSVDSIITFYNHEKTRLPEVLFKGEKGSLSFDVEEAVQIHRGTKQEKSFLILNTKGIFRKVTSVAA